MGMSEQLTDLELDHQRSPLTGWTRDHHVVVADRTLAALRSWASPGHARFALPGPASNAGPASDGLEAFARSFLSVGFLLSARTTTDPITPVSTPPVWVPARTRLR